MAVEPAEREVTPRPKVHRVTQVQVNAAKLRLVTDRKLGITSPEWVHRLAAAERR
ncbi:MAG: hypothetical protein AVDCRST_MAG35-1790 [uncultured Quadrisphaera sp.]|uniref:Uncharacterized protein n=1 Tax=uncultured Quadrisphaera sp. TaxID=904978 RepID=A0A6J4PLM2_9ACTN|nr:MAG: hypothetical protein AVDCRST_MAG35-1790 [uncultured Quadrisphaera sp.]